MGCDSNIPTWPSVDMLNGKRGRWKDRRWKKYKEVESIDGGRDGLYLLVKHMTYGVVSGAF